MDSRTSTKDGPTNSWAKAVKAREKAQEELSKAQRKMKTWKRKAEELAALEPRPRKSLRAIMTALSALPELSPQKSPERLAKASNSPKPRSVRSSPSSCHAEARALQRAEVVEPRLRPERDKVRCDANGVVKLSLSEATSKALKHLLTVLRRVPAPVNSLRPEPGQAGHRPAAYAAVPKAARVRPGLVELPVAQHRQSFLEAVTRNPVVIVQGATGCGKTTQLPQYLLTQAAEQQQPCRILVTQPRRVSCVSVAKRVAYERDEAIGQCVGYAIRHESRGGDSTCLTYCTQGVLLRWLESDPDLNGVTHIFADEVHERTVEGDLLLLLLQQLSKRRGKSLRIVAMSATLDAERLRQYFEATLLKLPGRMFPVKTLFLEDALEMTKHLVEQQLPNRRSSSRYRASTKYSGAPDCSQPKLEDLSNHAVLQRYSHMSSQTRSAISAMDPNVVNYDLAADVLRYFLSQDPPRGPDGPQDAILVFLSGAQEIERMRAALLEACPELKKDPANSWILNLHSSLQHEDQQLVFERPPAGVRKIILATNIAETSITIDDVGVVIDTGHVKELRYDSGRRLASLQDVFECRSSARQRRGRAGRVAPGVCVHLVTKYCHDQLMEEHQEPEVRRVPLEELLLRVYATGLPEVLNTSVDACQALLDPPDAGSVRSSLRQLRRLGFLTSGQLTLLGRRARPLPLAPHRAKLALLGTAFGPPICEVAACAAAALNAASWPFFGVGACSSSFDGNGRSGSRFEARRVHRQIAEEVSGGLGCSDLLDVLRVFGEWHALAKDDRRRGAAAWHLRSSALEEIEEARLQLLDLLNENHRSRPVALGGANGELAPLLVGLLAAASFPQIALAIPKETLSSSMGTGPVMSELFVDHKGSWVPVQVHPSSISAKEKIFGTPFVLYEELTETSRLYLRCITCVAPLTLLLFANLLSETMEQMQCSVHLRDEALVQLGMLKVLVPKKAADEILEIRSHLEKLVGTGVRGVPAEVLDALMEVLRQPMDMVP